MKTFRILLVVAGLAFFGAGLLIAQAFLTPPPAPVPRVAQPVAVQTKSVLVASVELDAGHFLQDADLAWNERPATTLRPDLYLQGADSIQALAGAVLLRPLKSGEAILRSNIVLPRDRGFLAAVLTSDMRSVSVAVDDVTGNAGLIFPGDRVDVIVTRTLPETAGPTKTVLGQVVLEDVRILAVDQTLRTPTEEAAADASKDKQQGGNNAAQQQGQRRTARTVTLEVKPQDAGVLAVSSTLGKLTLALRSIVKPDAAAQAAEPALKPIWAGDVLTALAELNKAPPKAEGKPEAEAQPGVTVLRGGTAKK